MERRKSARNWIFVWLLALAALGGWGWYRITGGPSESVERVVNVVREPFQPCVAGNYSIEDIQLDPVGKGRNKVSIKLRNVTDESQVVAVQVQTNTRDGGWGTCFFESLEPKQEKQCVFHYKFRDTLNVKSWVRFWFYNPPVSSFDSIDWEERLVEKKYLYSDLELRPPEEGKGTIVWDRMSTECIDCFMRFLIELRRENYEDAWNSLTVACQQADFFQQIDEFKKQMNPFSPKGEQFQGLTPKLVIKKGSQYTLIAKADSAEWRIAFATEDGPWKIDGIEGYVEESEREKVLSSMQKHEAIHFDIYYKKDSLVEKNVDRIAEERDIGYEEICKFLGHDPHLVITLVFYNDMESKREETGHQGAGFARGTDIVEVYNEETQLDPFHETTHIVAGELGDPPAIFNEGFATYMSERLGRRALKNLGGGELSLYEKVRENKGKGDWIPLGELLTYTEIGSERSNPPVAYPEAGAFVKFLIDAYGKETFIEAYKALKNSDDESIQKQNVRKLERCYGKSLEDLSNEWLAAMNLAEGK